MPGLAKDLSNQATVKLRSRFYNRPIFARYTTNPVGCGRQANRMRGTGNSRRPAVSACAESDR